MKLRDSGRFSNSKGESFRDKTYEVEEWMPDLSEYIGTPDVPNYVQTKENRIIELKGHIRLARMLLYKWPKKNRHLDKSTRGKINKWIEEIRRLQK